jgi:hypothetical protein
MAQLRSSTAEEHDELQLDSEQYDAGRHLPPTKVVAISCPLRLALNGTGSCGWARWAILCYTWW